MSIGSDMPTVSSPEDRLFERASELFLRLQGADAETAAALRAEAEEWRGEDAAHDSAYRKVEAAWGAVGDHATAPELIVARRHALERAGDAAKRRWAGGIGLRRYAAIAAALLLLLAAGPVYYFFSPQAGVQLYETAIGETRVLTMADNSRISLDAQTRLTAHYSSETRSIEMLAGQAHFDVAKDPMRPFRVKIGDRTVVALGTAFNVELLGDELLVTLIEGRVAVSGAAESALPDESESGRSDILDAQLAIAPIVHELTPGQQLVVAGDGTAELRQGINLARATAWQQGRLIFEDELLSAAVARMNRYSHLKIVIRDADLGDIGISGVFNAGDTHAFVEALEAYFPIKVERGDNGAIWLYSLG